jgi:hypothetical protein
MSKDKDLKKKRVYVIRFEPQGGFDTEVEAESEAEAIKLAWAEFEECEPSAEWDLVECYLADENEYEDASEDDGA